MSGIIHFGQDTIKQTICYDIKSSMLRYIILHKIGLVRIVSSFPSILYFVADMFFKTNGRICSFGEKKKKKYDVYVMSLLTHNLVHCI